MDEKNKIPKIIHQIWIGKKKKPECYMKSWSDEYVKKYPSYKYIFWDEEAINMIKMSDKIKKLYEIEPIMAGKADIARYCILYEYGGIYIDADSVWVNRKNLDNIIEQCKDTGFFAAKEPEKNHLTNGVIGCSKNHDNIKFLLDNLENIHDNYLTIRRSKAPWETTGPLLINKLAIHKKKLTIVPTIYFYPCRWHGISDPEIHTKIEIPKESYMFQYGITTNNLNYAHIC